MTTTRRRQHQQLNRLRRIALGLFVLAVLEAVVITTFAVNCASDAAPAPEETAPAPTAETSVPETEAPTPFRLHTGRAGHRAGSRTAGDRRAEIPTQ